MTVWASRVFSDVWPVELQEAFVGLYRADSDMLLVSSKFDRTDDIVLLAAVPSVDYLRALPGFQQISEESLPHRASLIVGDQHEFEKWFRFDIPGE